MRAFRGYGLHLRFSEANRTVLGKPAEEGESPVCESVQVIQSTAFKASWSCMKERMVDALALRADERRDKLRKASGRSKYPLIRRYLNGETRRRGPPSLHTESIGMQGEPGELKHLSSRRKRKKHRFPK